MKKTLLLIPVLLSLLLLVYSSCKQDDPHHPIYSGHEELSKDRYEAMQAMMTKYADDTTDAHFKLLTARLDAQLKLEEYLIKYREANHAKSYIWIPIYVSIASLLLSIFSFVYSIRSRQKEKKEQ
jgi:hypothetical protein